MLPEPLTQARLKEVLDYSPETGEFVWKVRKSQSVKAGQKAGSLNPDGHIQIIIDGVKYKAHRVVWLYVYGEWPEDGLVVDHINRDRKDNRISNLRVVTNQVNLLNTAAKGYYWCETKQKYIARLGHNYKKIDLGSFDTEEEASDAYQRAKRELTQSLLD